MRTILAVIFAVGTSLVGPDVFATEKRLSDFAGSARHKAAGEYALDLRREEVKLYNEGLRLNHRRLETQQLELEAALKRKTEEDKILLELFHRQLAHHRVILVTVLILVGSGVALVFWQFMAWSRKNEITASTFEIGKEGFKVRSPFIGLMMLIVSYGFFYMYLVEVYRIRPLADGTVTRTLANAQISPSDSKAAATSEKKQ